MLTVRRSKTDREGAGATVAVPLGEEATCPGALRRWLAAAAIGEGRVFRRIDRHDNLGPTLSDRALAEIVAARAPPALKATSPGIRCAPGLRRRPRGPGARRPRSCTMGAGRACRSPAATSLHPPRRSLGRQPRRRPRTVDSVPAAQAGDRACPATPVRIALTAAQAATVARRLLAVLDEL